SEHEARIAYDLARAALPPFGVLPGADQRTVIGLSRWLAEMPSTVRASYIAGLWALEGSAVLSHGKPFTRRSPRAQADLLEARQQSRRYIERTLLQALVVPLKWLHFDAPEMRA